MCNFFISLHLCTEKDSSMSAPSSVSTSPPAPPPVPKHRGPQTVSQFCNRTVSHPFITKLYREEKISIQTLLLVLFQIYLNYKYAHSLMRFF